MDWALTISFALVGFFLGFLTKDYLPQYFGQKGKNLATKEDIEEITQKTEKARQRQRRKEEEIKAVEEYLHQFADLIELYRFMAHKEVHLETNEQGEQIWVETPLEPKLELSQAFKETEEISIRSAIYQRIVTIRRMSGEVSDIVVGIDPALNRKFVKIFGVLTTSGEHAIRHKDFGGLVIILDGVGQIRREIYSTLQDYRNNDR